MKILLGPILYAQEQTAYTHWNFSLHLYCEGSDAPDFDVTFNEVNVQVSKSPTAVFTGFQDLKDYKNKASPWAGTVWRWDVDVKREAAPRLISYEIKEADGHLLHAVDRVLVPAVGHIPRIAFFSCNGVMSPAAWAKLENPLALWKQMLREHLNLTGAAVPAGYSLLLGGGDQLYADALRDPPAGLPHHDELFEFNRLDAADKRNFPASPGLQRQLQCEYVRIYCERWGPRSGFAEMACRAPGAFTWDDHDIFDGWGSHEELQDAPVYQAFYAAAKEAYVAFQLGAAKRFNPPPAGHEHFLQTLTFGGKDAELDVVLLDLRSARTRTQVMSEEQWADLDAVFAEHAKRKAKTKRRRHLLVVSSIPLVYLRFSSGIESVSGGRVGMRDDLLDQWESESHDQERIRLIMNLFKQTAQATCAVTVLSGDVHVGSSAQLRSQEPAHRAGDRPVTVIEQVTSSGIVYPPPNMWEWMGLSMVSGEGPEDLPGLVSSELKSVGTHRFLRERNWLDIETEQPRPNDQRAEMRLQWVAESGRVGSKVLVTPPT